MNSHDQTFREAALNPAKSFIVQAPAGSGKTELLTQRFLRLLSTVKKPEEIIAITFTRKAASEMRHRVLQALIHANSSEKIDSAHAQQTRSLALSALDQNQKFQWDLLENPNRLRIFTIDALSSAICAQTPILSQLGGQPNIAEDASHFYRLATREFLKDFWQPPEVLEKIETLLLHLDNRVSQLEDLFVHILGKREQWLLPIMRHQASPQSLKKHLENALKNVSRETLNTLKALIPDDLQSQLLKLAQFSAQELSEPYPTWKAITNLVLTQTGSFRKSITKNLGFPPKHPMKIELENLLASFNEDETLRHAFHEFMQCPPLEFNENQWGILESLLLLLPRLTAQLQLIFSEHQVVDFVELNLRASFALGSPENPTDLALYLDHKIQHLLIDEFQDTSVTQFTLIEKLIAGWAPGDGRSVFLVGDPMQSIYRFREANVGLFLRAKKRGIADLALEFIPLQSNFRSDTEIVNWLNANFPRIFPSFSDISSGAVPYSPAQAVKNSSEKCGVFFYPTQSEVDEAEALAKLVEQLQAEDPKQTMAILVRSRTHLSHILPTLSKHKIEYQALEIESLGNRPEIQDLFTLTKALCHLGNRLAWLALLRTPFCGLKLEDLYVVAQAIFKEKAPLPSEERGYETARESFCIWEILEKYEALNLSSDGMERLQRIVPILQLSFSKKGHLPIAQWIEATWLYLSGPAVLNDEAELQNTGVFFQTLAKLDETHRGLSLQILEETLQKMSATPKSSEARLQIMTIHKAKGLEFDQVILPALSKSAAHDPSQILLWLERANNEGGNDLLLAPIKSAEEDSDPIYTYLRKIEKEKAQNELARLFYVGLTRAKKAAHCFATLTKDPKNPAEFLKPAKGSFLEFVWDSFLVESESLKNSASLPIDIPVSTPHFARLIQDSTTQAPVFTEAKKYFVSQEMFEDFKPSKSAIIGTLIHLALEKLSQGKTMSNAYWKNQAMLLGLRFSEIEDALQHIQKAIQNTLNDEKGRWILQARKMAGSEVRLSTHQDGIISSLIIDRSFCDENNVRWIIDYKTSVPQNQSLEEFLDHEKARYRKQLEQYSDIFAKLDSRPIRAALYFPMIPHFVELEVMYAV